jgi:MFS family permease
MQLTQEAYAREIERHATWNLVVNLLDITFYSLAMSFIFGATVLTLYASRLTNAALLVGLVPTVQNLAFVLPQLLMSRQAERLPVKKWLLVRVSFIERLPYSWIGLLILFAPGLPPMLMYGILLFSLLLAAGAGGIGAPAWKSMLSKVVPANRRGFMFGVSSAAGSLLGLGGAWLSRHMLATLPFPKPFAYSFLLCFVCQIISYAFVALNREPPRQADGEAVSAREYWRRLPRVLQRNPNFSRYLAARGLIIMGSMATAFFMIFAKARFGVADTFAAELTMAALLSQAIFTPLLGVVSDRKGLKWLIEFSTVLQLAAMALVLVSPASAWLYGVFILVYAASAGMMIASMAMSMEFSVPEDVPTFTALEGTVIAIPTMLAPLLGGWLVDHISLGSGPVGGGPNVSGYQIMFVVAALFSIAGYVAMRWFVREPRYEAPGVGIGGAE